LHPEAGGGQKTGWVINQFNSTVYIVDKLVLAAIKSNKVVSLKIEKCSVL